jgi:hypothetical protein
MAAVLEQREVNHILLQKRVREYVALVRCQSGDISFEQRSKMKGELLAELERLANE